MKLAPKPYAVELECVDALKPGGVFRVVCPMLEPLLSFDPMSPPAKIYADGLVNYFSSEDKALGGLGLGGVNRFSKEFLLNNLFMNFEHRFIWSADLMRQVLCALGFGKAEVKKVGESVNPQYAIERRHRGLYSGSDWKHDRESLGPFYDPESGVVEAIK